MSFCDLFVVWCNALTKPSIMGWQNFGKSLKNTGCAKPFKFLFFVLQQIRCTLMQSKHFCSFLLRTGRRSRVLQGCLVFLAFILLYYLLIKPSPTTIRAIKLNEPNSNHAYQLVIMVMTGPKNKDRRDTMRKTWLLRSNTIKKGDTKHLFVIGTKNLASEMVSSLAKEQSEHRDMLLLMDFEDSYDKLTEKLALMLEWLDKSLQFNYVFKVDDDTFALLDPILKELSADRENLKSNLFWGYFYGRSRVKTKGPWKETDWKLCDYYLPYARGGGYILSSSLVSFVAKNWRQFQMYHSEDVSLGAWLAPLKVNRVHDARFDTEFKSRGCKNAFIVSHKQSIQEMNNKFTSWKNSGQICEKETVVFHGYNYNWDVPPSQCCERSSHVP